MDRAAVFVDAGYLFAASSRLLTGELLPRSRLTLDYDAVLDLFAKLVTETAGMPLLRIYWYDGTATGPTPQQITLAYRPSVKVRLGFVNQNGEQKGVDSLIVTDLISLSRNRAMADALLLTGDEDIRVGVQQAQEFGVRVHLLGIAPARENQSRFLVQEAECLRPISRENGSEGVQEGAWAKTSKGDALQRGRRSCSRSGARRSPGNSARCARSATTAQCKPQAHLGRATAGGRSPTVLRGGLRKADATAAERTRRQGRCVDGWVARVERCRAQQES